MIAARREAYHAELAKGRMKSGKKADPVANLPQGDTGKARDKAGAELNVSGRTVSHAKKVINEGSKALTEAVERGDVPVSRYRCDAFAVGRWRAGGTP